MFIIVIVLVGRKEGLSLFIAVDSTFSSAPVIFSDGGGGGCWWDSLAYGVMEKERWRGWWMCR